MKIIDERDFTDVATWERRITQGLGMTIKEFAKIIGLHPLTIKNAISGKHEPTCVTKRHVEDYFRIRGV